MKKVIVLIALLIPFLFFSQNEKNVIQAYLNANQAKLNLTHLDINDWIIESTASSKTTKITNYYIKQRCNGIEVYNALSNVWIKDNQVIHMGNRFIQNANQKANAVDPQINVLQALAMAKTQLGIVDSFANTILSAESTNSFILSNTPKSKKITAKLLYEPIENQLLLAWHFVIDVPNQHHVWNVRINALNGTIIDKTDKIISCHFAKEDSISNQNNFFFYQKGYKQNNAVLETQSSAYKVVPYNIESPNHGPRQLITSPGDGVASPYGWHDTDGFDGPEFTITRGNNVYAFDDRFDTEEGDSPNGGASLTFNYTYYGINQDAYNSLNAATTNLFYMNNIIHDVFYHYGFDEESGNFQYLNYNNQGDGFDNVLAQSQDGGGMNNANFYTPIDGENSVMQMYLWNRKRASDIINVLSPLSISGPQKAFESSSGPNDLRLPIAPNFLEGQLTTVDDGDADINDACTPIINASDVNGKIVLIKRGNCLTNDKLLNAQAAGAIAVIFYTDLPGNSFVGGYIDFDVTIPAISVKKEVADVLLTEMANNPVFLRLSSPESSFVNVDGDFDNLVIAHEYGHGISNRLTGGRYNTDCLNNAEQMGEGWSDWFGLMMQLKAGDTGEQSRGIGTFVINQPTNDVGIRNYPYSTNMAVNPFTFADTNVVIKPHGVGSVWATMLWDLTWAYIQKYGFDPNIYTGNGGNNKVLQLVVDALKLQPCLPSFVDGRDAIIAADQAITGGQDYCMIWEVFARRGLGLSASSGDADSSTDQIESFDTPAAGPNCTLGIDYEQNDELISVYPNPSQGVFTIKINAFSGTIGYEIFDLNGRKITEKSHVDVTNECQVTLGTIQAGVYLIKITIGNSSVTKKLIIQ